MNGRLPGREQPASDEPTGPGSAALAGLASGITRGDGSAVPAGPAGAVRVSPFGEAALLVELDPGSVRPAALGRFLAAALSRNGLPVGARAVKGRSGGRALEGVEDLVVGEESVVVLVDPLRCDVGALETILLAWLSLEQPPSGAPTEQPLSGAPSAPGTVPTPRPRLEGVEAAATVTPVPIRYDGEDLRSVADLVGLSVEEVAARHAAPVYEVTMIGFAPGFCYLSGLDPVLALPRLDTPRARVPAGAVGIAGLRSCIYPTATPGGWRLLGRTSLALWDPAREPPSRFRPGDRLRFVADPT